MDKGNTAIRTGVMWCDLSRGSYQPYTDKIGGNDAEAGCRFLKQKMSEVCEPVFNRPDSVRWNRDLIQNVKPMNMSECERFLQKETGEFVLDAIEQHVATDRQQICARTTDTRSTVSSRLGRRGTILRLLPIWFGANPEKHWKV